jgi:hypothetical protein
MKSRFHRRLDPNLITVLLVVVIAALPFLTRPGLPRHTDLELHVLRAAEYGEVLRDGVLYPRWAPDFYYGYGYPIFNYYAPFTYALSNLFDLIPGVDVAAAMKLVILTAYALGAYGTYFFARRHFGVTAGVIGSAAFVLSPYFLFIDPLMRGDVAEFLALGWLPWVFYVFDRPRRFSIAPPLVLAAFVFSHNLLALMGAVLLALYLLWRGLLLDGVKRWASDALSIGLAAALTAIFWLPFMAERDLIRLNVAGPGHFDYHNHFVPLSMLLAQSPALDMAATTPKYIYNLGLVQWLLLVPASVAAAWRRKQVENKIALFFVLITLVLIFLITPVSTFLWDSIPPAALVQFPWRFLGPAAFTLAVAVASLFQPAPFHAIRTAPHSAHLAFRVLRVTFPALVLFALFVSALPTMYPPLWQAAFGDTSPRGMIDFELSGVALGTTSTGDFLPKPIGREPGPAASLLDSYAAGLIDKFDRATLPAGATVQVEDHSAAYDRFRVDTPGEFKGRLLTFLFPGWSVLVDGVVVPAAPQDQTGFMEFHIPAGAHVIEAVFSPTQSRILGGFVSLGALIVVAVLGVSRRERVQPAPAPRPAFAWALCAVSAAFLIGKIAVADRCDACFRYTSPAGQALGAQHQQHANFGGHIALLGYDLPVAELAAGQALPLTLYWRATVPVPHNYQVFAQLTQPDTVLWGQSDKLNPGDFPSTRWPLDKFVWDDHRVPVLPGTPPGVYRLAVGLYDLASGQRVPVLDESGQIAGDRIVLDVPVRVTAPASPPAIESLGIQHPLDRVYSGSRLLGWSIEAPVVQAPNFARLTLFWQGLAGSSAVHRRTDLIDRTGKVRQSLESTVPALQNGEIRRDQVAFWLPPDFPAGVYDVSVRVLDEALNITSIEVEK